MKDEKIQTGLRIPLSRYDELKVIADRSGVSVNSIILHLIDIGLRVVNSGILQETHVLLHTPQHSDELRIQQDC